MFATRLLVILSGIAGGWLSAGAGASAAADLALPAFQPLRAFAPASDATPPVDATTLDLSSSPLLASATAGLTPSAFQPLPAFAANSVWTSPVNGPTALDPSSSALVASLNAYVNPEITGRWGPWINTTKYSVPVYTVPASQAKVPVILDQTQPYTAGLKASFAAGVPIPPGALPAAGTDQQLVIWQPSSDTMWEFWKMNLQADGWHAKWGGTMTHVSQNPGYFTTPNPGWGARASSLPLVGGLMTPSELQAGVIPHALTLAIPDARAAAWSWPAQRTDGGLTTAASIPEGAHFRLDPSLNLASLNLPPVTLTLARAAQKYGVIIADRSGTVTFYAQDPTPTGTNPYPALFGNQLPSLPLASFPWSRLQLLPMQLNH